jgi:hypothetical protein
MERVVDLMLDSGAFTAWSRGATLDIKKYCNFIHQHKHLLFSYVALDEIPGSKADGRAPSPREVAASAAKSYDNLQVMHGEGLDPIPVFHQGEDFKWLERLLRDGEPYIGISPSDAQSRPERGKWLDEVFSALTNRDGKPFVKTHGFGITDHLALIRFPWHSVDATSWIIKPAYGWVLVPSYNKNGEPNYRKPTLVVVSTHRNDSPKSFENCTPEQKDWVRKYLREVVGCEVVRIRHVINERARAMLIYYAKLEQELQGNRFLHHKRDLRSQRSIIPAGLRPLENLPLHIFHATQLSAHYKSSVLTETNSRWRLLSYYELMDGLDVHLPTYVKHGSAKPEHVRENPGQNWKNATYRNYRAMRAIERIAAAEARDEASST